MAFRKTRVNAVMADPLRRNTQRGSNGMDVRDKPGHDELGA